MFLRIKQAYQEEFGDIDPIISKAAEELWPAAKHLAINILHDEHEAYRLLLSATAMVSRAYISNPNKIKDIKSYLYTTYKRLVFTQLKRDEKHKELDQRVYDETRSLSETSIEDTLNDNILIAELVNRMDEDTKKIFQLLSLGYSFEEIAAFLGSAANIIRSKWSKKISKLSKQIQKEVDEADKKARGK